MAMGAGAIGAGEENMDEAEEENIDEAEDGGATESVDTERDGGGEERVEKVGGAELLSSSVSVGSRGGEVAPVSFSISSVGEGEESFVSVGEGEENIDEEGALIFLSFSVPSSAAGGGVKLERDIGVKEDIIIP